MLREPQPLPDIVPVITFDNEIGKGADYIDFNYPAFDSLARAYGMTDDDISNFHFHFKAKQNFWELIAPTQSLGQYRPFFGRPDAIALYDTGGDVPCHLPDPSTPDVAVNFDRSVLSPEERLDIVVRHEIGHWVDHRAKGPGYKAYLKLRAKQLGALAIGLGLPMLTEVGTDHVSYGVIASALGSIALLAKSHHQEKSDPVQEHEKPIEKPAYEFERDTRDYTLISLNLKSGLRHRLSGIEALFTLLASPNRLA